MNVEARLQKDFPKISIVTPNYNYAKFIGETIESVLSQDYREVEHVIVDDGSTDNSVEVIRRYVDKYPERIKLITQKNAGQTAAINTGLKNASGEILGWINSDDTYCPNILGTIVDHFRNDPNLDVVFGDVNVMDVSGEFIYRIRHLDFDYLMGCFLGFGKVTTSNAVFWRRTVMQGTELLNEHLECNMDGEFYSRLMKNAKVVHVTLPMANFRKQAVTKAFENRNDGSEIFKRELELELVNSFNRLKVSGFVSVKYRGLLVQVFALKRILLRAVKGHYLLEFIEKRRYKKKSK